MPSCIMAIDDAPDILELYRDILTDEGYQVALYSCAVQALAEVEHVMPQLIILGYQLGKGIDGVQVIQQLRANRATAAIPVMLCTTTVHLIQQIEDALRADGIGICYKPFELEDFLTRIDQMLHPPANHTEPED
jgi:DNA-binding response OmpR family regulator